MKETTGKKKGCERGAEGSILGSSPTKGPMKGYPTRGPLPNTTKKREGIVGVGININGNWGPLDGKSENKEKETYAQKQKCKGGGKIARVGNGSLHPS